MGGDAVQEPAIVARSPPRSRGIPAAPLPVRAGFPRPDRWSVRPAATRCRPAFSSLARCTRLRSPPDRSPTRFCWSEPLKLKRPTVGAGRHLELADSDHVLAVGNLLPDGFFVVQVVAALVHVGHLHRLARSALRRYRVVLCRVIMRNSVDLPAPLGPMMPTMAPGGI